MEFLNPAALSALYFLPLLLVPYLIKGRTRRLRFSSLLLLRDLSKPSVGRRWRTLRLPPIFFLQFLLLFLLILALGEPVFSVRPTNIAIVLDNSASMQALEHQESGEKSRFEIAKDKTRDLLRSVSTEAKIDLYLISPRFEQFGGKTLGPGEAVPLIAALEPFDLGEPSLDYGKELSRLVEEKGYERVYFLTDHPVRNQGETIKVSSVGSRQKNLAITSFHISRSSFALSQSEARVEVTNFSSEQERIKVLLKGGEKVLSSRTVTVAPRKSVTLSFDRFPAHPYYEAELGGRDALALDNRRFAVSPVTKRLEILGVSPRPKALYSLRSLPGVSLNVISPKAYEESRDEGHSLEIFHYASPALLPKKHALFILPPEKNPLVAIHSALSRPIISDWREPHPLTRYVNFTLFQPPYARTIEPLSFGEAIVQSPEGALAVALEHHGRRYLILGFDPFPYLGRKNLPVSIFTLNILEWFYRGLGGSSKGTGEPLDLSALQGGVLVTPKDEKFPVAEGARLFTRTFFQGIYQVNQGGEKNLTTVNFAVNLQDLKESDLMHPVPIDLKEAAEASDSRSFLFSLWPYLLLLSLLLLVLEWFFNPPVTRSSTDGLAAGVRLARPE